jgi:hypothetical protein
MNHLRPPVFGTVERVEGNAAYEAGPKGLEILVIGAPNLGEARREDVDGQRDWWADE